MPTVTAGGNHIAEVRAFLTAYYSEDGAQGKGQDLRDPMRTITTKARLGLVTVHGIDYQIVDICFRMVEWDELANAQFTPELADLIDLSHAKSKEKKTQLIGNSVPPLLAEAVIAANTKGARRRRNRGQLELRLAA
jgi:DNA (cytosine-5)-methyltransferase 1